MVMTDENVQRLLRVPLDENFFITTLRVVRERLDVSNTFKMGVLGP
jgi:hypothetical protein